MCRQIHRKGCDIETLTPTLNLNTNFKP